MKIWLDDVRRPPDESWTWAKNVSDAKTAVSYAMASGRVIEEMSLDHDLGADLVRDVGKLSDEERYMLRGTSEQNGAVFAEWLASKIRDHGGVSPCLRNCAINVHSWNPLGAMRIVATLRDAGLIVNRIPFSLESAGLAS